MIMLILLVPAALLGLLLGMDRLERWAVEGWAVEGNNDQVATTDGRRSSA